MTKEERLTLLKNDLQMITSSNDSLLSSLLDASVEYIQKEGITLVENDIGIDMVIVQYAAYLFRKRASEETAMPRFLRYNLNNILFSQKGKRNDI